MIADRLPDCRPPRHDDSLTSASSHPELLCGYLAMRPRIHLPLTPAEQAIQHKWSRRTIVALVLIVAGVLALPVFKQDPNRGLEARAHSRPYAPTCAPWDAAASQAIVHLVQSKPDMDLTLVSDAIVRMRRARRSCELGWINLACQDYQAIMRGAAQSGDAPDTLWICESLPPA